MKDERLILACDSETGSLGPVALRLLRLGFDTVYAAAPDEALLVADEAGARVRALVFPPHLGPTALAPIAARVAAAPGSPCPPAQVVIGPRPDAARCAALREAGVQWALWSLDDEGALRFVLNSALALPAELAPRKEPRVPTNLLGSFEAEGARHNAVVYTLSPRGAFFETPRPVGKGTPVRIEIWLPGRPLRARGIVIHANEPGAAREPRWPLGMSVVFAGLGPSEDAFLRRYVAERAALFTL